MKEISNFIRTKLAESLRKQPYQISALVGGIDERGPQLFWMDYMGTMAEVPYGAHGHAGYLVPSVFSNGWHPDLTLEEGMVLVKKAIHELKVRYMIAQEHFIVKVIQNGEIKRFEL